MPAIKVENLGKSYLVGHNAAQGERYTALRDVIARNARDLARKTRDMIQGRPIIQGDEVEEFWALKDINFEIQQGDRVGIIGRNGAGKSTLLKILSRITEPTTGRITINGRVASLLEVGTGFHPELTGRENIFLNGAILGMSRKEIQKKFDEIVDFAEVEKFLDTPVKRYSSGMYVRLAFAVAAHLEPEIMVVDEVLAVGDTQFQKKCLGKMRQVAGEGRTVLFVSHNMAAIQNLCNTGLLLDKGLLATVGSINNVITSYSRQIKYVSRNTNSLAKAVDQNLILESISFADKQGCPIGVIQCGQDLQFLLHIKAFRKYSKCIVSIGVDDQSFSRVTLLANILNGLKFDINEGNKIIKCYVRELNLCPGDYYLSVKISDLNGVIIWAERAAGMTIETSDFFGTGKLLTESWVGNVLMKQEWKND